MAHLGNHAKIRKLDFDEFPRFGKPSVYLLVRPSVLALVLRLCQELFVP